MIGPLLSPVENGKIGEICSKVPDLRERLSGADKNRDLLVSVYNDAEAYLTDLKSAVEAPTLEVGNAKNAKVSLDVAEEMRDSAVDAYEWRPFNAVNPQRAYQDIVDGDSKWSEGWLYLSVSNWSEALSSGLQAQNYYRSAVVNSSAPTPTPTPTNTPLPTDTPEPYDPPHWSSSDSDDYDYESSDGGDDSGSWDYGDDSGSWDSGGSDYGWDSGSDAGSWDSGGDDSGSWDTGGDDSGSWKIFPRPSPIPIPTVVLTRRLGE